MNTTRVLSIANGCTVLSIGVGLLASYWWFQSAMVGEPPKETVDQGVHEIVVFLVASAKLNQKAAGATAVALISKRSLNVLNGGRRQQRKRSERVPELPMRFHLLASDVKCPACGGDLMFVRVRGYGDLYQCASDPCRRPGHALPKEGKQDLRLRCHYPLGIVWRVDRVRYARGEGMKRVEPVPATSERLSASVQGCVIHEMPLPDLV